MDPGIDPHPGLTLATLDAARADPDDERIRGWVEGLRRGFHHGRPNDAFRTAWLDHCRADEVVIRGVWPSAPSIGSGTIPVATYASFDKTLNSGSPDGSLLPLRMITDITVSPTHRRRGLLRRLMTEDLRDAVDMSVPVAALTASEGSIYGRFGFGIATHVRHLEVDTTSRFTLRDAVGDVAPGHADGGHVELLEPAEAWPAVESVFARFHQRTRGSVERPQFYRTLLTGVLNFEEQAPDKQLRAAVHLDAEGEPDGHVLYRHVGREDGRPTVDVTDLVALTDAAYLVLWRFLAGLDLVQRVRWRSAPVEDPLAWALVEPYAAQVVRTEDLLWVRVLDVPAALEARPWGADGEAVLDVDDPLGHAAGRYRVTTTDGRATVSRCDDQATVRLGVETLGSLYLGGVAVATLARAGRLAGDEAALRTWAAMCETGPAPYCITGF